jgi:secreted PhoX family phosphatase
MQETEVKLNRRGFLKQATAGGLVTATTIGTLSAHTAWAKDECRFDRRGGKPRHGKPGKGYGPLRRAADENGQEILALPEGFHYVTFGKTGELMDDGFPTPRNHDGMTCFESRHGIIRLIRNHEVRNAAGDFTMGVIGPEATRYDLKANGGCVTLDFDTRRKKLLRSFTSINGTIVNCSGGLSFKDKGWLTCEESVSGPAQGFDKPHGYTFFVSKDAEQPAPAVPLTAMGRFAKEAAVADNESGIVYQTEDSGNNSGLYRFLPNDPENLPAGGVLQMLAIRGMSNYDTRLNQIVDVELPVEWVTIDNPNPATITSSTSCFAQGFARGGARFNRLEGIFRGDDGSMYFVSTSGGNAARGQLWRFTPSFSGGGSLALVFESPGSGVLDSPDNICVSPSGGILFCEDDASNDADTHPLAPGFSNVDRLIGLSRSGEPFEFAVNIHNQSEFAGACFSPDGDILFVNIFGDGNPDSGMTCAIWGPWRRGPL